LEVYTVGLVLAVSVTVARFQDGDGTHPVMEPMVKYFGIESGLADTDYSSRCYQTMFQAHGVHVRVVHPWANGHFGR
jgi:hypothetical protein